MISFRIMNKSNTIEINIFGIFENAIAHSIKRAWLNNVYCKHNLTSNFTVCFSVVLIRNNEKVYEKSKFDADRSRNSRVQIGRTNIKHLNRAIYLKYIYIDNTNNVIESCFIK